MCTCGDKRTVAEAGTTRESSDLWRVVEDGCMDDASKADWFQVGHEYAPRSRARLRVGVVKSRPEPLGLQTVDSLLTRWMPW